MKKIIENCKKPEGFLGRLMIGHMNRRHSPLIQWGLHGYDNAQRILDIGCGGGNTMRFMLNNSNAKVYGVDYSPLCIKKSIFKNKKYIKNGRADISIGNVLHLDFPDKSFDMVTAVETIYFWEPLSKALEEIYRVLKEGGKLLIVNELTLEKENSDEYLEIKKDIKMNIFTENQLVKIVEEKGFAIKEVLRENSWMSLTAYKI